MVHWLIRPRIIEMFIDLKGLSLSRIQKQHCGHCQWETLDLYRVLSINREWTPWSAPGSKSRFVDYNKACRLQISSYFSRISMLILLMYIHVCLWSLNNPEEFIQSRNETQTFYLSARSGNEVGLCENGAFFCLFVLFFNGFWLSGVSIPYRIVITSSKCLGTEKRQDQYCHGTSFF